MPYFVGGGLSYQGVIPRRDNDIASAAVIYGSFSRYIPRTTAETVIEMNYQITVTRLALYNAGPPVCHQARRQQRN